MLKRLGRLFVIKTRLEACMIIYALALGSLARGEDYLAAYPGFPGYLMLAATTGAVFLAGAKLLEITRPDTGKRRRKSDIQAQYVSPLSSGLCRAYAGRMRNRTYLRPAGFVDAPFGYDRQVARLAGGLAWFSAVEAIGGGDAQLVPVEAVPDRLEEWGEDAQLAWHNLTLPRTPLTLGARTVRLDQPQVVGILNVTPDSFSDGGRHLEPSGAADAGFAMASAGAAMVDIGGESTRPGARPAWEQDEISRVLPVVERLAASGTAVSIDTRKAAVMEAALGAGAAMVNDVSALTFDPLSAAMVARAGCPVVLMHHQGTPETMQTAPRYSRPVLLEVYDWLEQRIEAAVAAGIDRSRIIVDPGIGFGKTVQHNLQLLNGLAMLHGLGCAVMLGASRKRMIGALSAEAPVDQRLAGSLALALKGAEQGVQLLRVHDVPETVQALKVWRGLRDSALTPQGSG